MDFFEEKAESSKRIMDSYQSLIDEFKGNVQYLPLDAYGLYIAVSKLLNNGNDTEPFNGYYVFKEPNWLQSTSYMKVFVGEPDSKNYCLFSIVLSSDYNSVLEDNKYYKMDAFNYFKLGETLRNPTEINRTFGEGNLYVVYQFSVSKLYEAYGSIEDIGRYVTGLFNGIHHEDEPKRTPFLIGGTKNTNKYDFSGEKGKLIEDFINYLVAKQIENKKFLNTEEMCKCAVEFLDNRDTLKPTTR